jgi:LPXTG-site transpeptidase (sortase) family protein
MAAPASPSPDNEPAPAEQKSRANLTMMGAVALLVLAMSLTGGKDTSADPPRVPDVPPAAGATSATSPTGATSATSPTGPGAGKHLPRSRPVRLLIPKISVDAPFTDLAMTPTGQLEPPPADDINLVGWFAGGASPGEAGTSIIAGHVDTKTSAAVFAGLHELTKGDVFRVLRADGRTATFVVDSAETFDKKHFPSRRVYGDTPQAQARLITCAGDYDRTVKDYMDNLVVFAHLV